MHISVITINFNNLEGLKKTVKSVLDQTKKPYEYIIIDGGSTDGGKEFIEDISHQTNYIGDCKFTWRSEPDKGVYNAMNKGVALSNGEYCIFMNSGDTFFDNKVLSVIDQQEEADYICGDSFSDGKITESPDNIISTFLFKSAVCHQAEFIRTSLLREMPYDESLKLVSDWKHMFLSVVYNNATYKHINVTVCNYDKTGMSTVNWKLLAEERENTLKENLSSFMFDYFTNSISEENISINNPKLLGILSHVKPQSIEERFIMKSLDLLDLLRKIKHCLI